ARLPSGPSPESRRGALSIRLRGSTLWQSRASGRPGAPQESVSRMPMNRFRNAASNGGATRFSTAKRQTAASLLLCAVGLCPVLTLPQASAQQAAPAASSATDFLQWQEVRRFIDDM